MILLTSTEFFLPRKIPILWGNAPIPHFEMKGKVMRKRRIKKNFWFDEDEDNTLKNLSSLSGKTEVQVIRKLIKGTTIKEKPPQEFYETMKEFLQFRKEIKTIKDLSKYTKQLDTKRVAKTLKGIDELRMRIAEKYLK